jgi:hypothetical protein
MLTAVVSVALALLGLLLLILGIAFFIGFRMGLRVFDKSLKSEVAATGQQHVEQAAAKISNPLVRRFVLQYLVQAGGSVAVSAVRGAIESRMRTGLYMALFGAFLMVSATFAPAWLIGALGWG